LSKEEEEGEEDESVGDLVSSLAHTALSSPWSDAPSYEPLYLDTLTEYILPAPITSKGLKKGMEEGRGAKAYLDVKEWGHEAYEESRGVDEVFERFAKRVGASGEQCVRYDRRAVPLFYQSTDETYKSLHTVPAGTQVHVTGARNMLVSSSGGGRPSRRAYNPDAEKLKRCDACRRATTMRSAGGERVFEFQLVPHLISVLRAAGVGSKKGANEGNEGNEVRKTEGEDGKKDKKEGLSAKEWGLERTGMEWGTVLVFTCRDDCCGGRVADRAAKECWQEEFVLVQWEE